MIYDLWIINHHRWLKDLKSLKSNQPKFELRFRFIIQLTSDLAEHCSWVSRLLNFGRLRCVQFRGNRHRPNFCLLGRGGLHWSANGDPGDAIRSEGGTEQKWNDSGTHSTDVGCIRGTLLIHSSSNCSSKRQKWHCWTTMNADERATVIGNPGNVYRAPVIHCEIHFSQLKRPQWSLITLPVGITVLRRRNYLNK